MQNTVLRIGDIRLLCRQHFEQTGDKLSFFMLIGWQLRGRAIFSQHSRAFRKIPF